MKVQYFSLDDTRQLVSLSQQLGWYSQTDWECFVRSGVVFGHRLQSNEIVSSAYFSNFENKIGWLGAVIVNSKFQGMKLGKALIEKALSISPSEDFVLGLISTERGKKMYEQAGFVEIGNTHKFVLEQNSSLNSGSEFVQPFQTTHLKEILELDLKAVGYKREKLLTLRLNQAEKIFVSHNSHSEITGFSMQCLDGDRKIIGPIVSDNFETASQLLLAHLQQTSHFRIDVPHWQTEMISLLPKLGFKLERICPLMTFKGLSLLKTSDNYFAIMAQALG